MSDLQMNRLTKSQFFFFTLHAQLGMAILSLPHILGLRAGHDGWISVIVCLLFALGLSALYYFIVKQYPDKIFFEITVDIFGKTAGKVINLILITYYFLYAVLMAQKCIDVLNLWLYYRTPPWVLISLFIFVCYYIVNADLQIIGRFLILSSFFIFLILFFVTWTIQDLNPLYLLPIGEAGITNILKGSFHGITAFAGFETFLFIHAFTAGTVKTKVKWERISILTAGSFYLITTLICFMYFPNAAKNIEHPVVYLLVPTKFTILERIEVFFLAGWVVVMITSCMCFLYVCCLGIGRLRKRADHKKEVGIVALIMFILTILADKVDSLSFWITVESVQLYFTYVTILFIPLLVAVIMIFKGRKVNKHET